MGNLAFSEKKKKEKKRKELQKVHLFLDRTKDAYVDSDMGRHHSFKSSG